MRDRLGVERVAIDAAQDEKFNCFSREVWTADKVAWCCEHEGLGCGEREGEREGERGREAVRISAVMSTTGDADKPASWALDGVLDQWFKTDDGMSNWVSVRVSAGQNVGYVAVYNWLGTAANRARLGDFEIWVGRAAGDTDTANGAIKCGESSYKESKFEEEPYVLWCGEASSGWSDSDGGEYITVKQVGDSRELRLTELMVYAGDREDEREREAGDEDELEEVEGLERGRRFNGINVRDEFGSSRVEVGTPRTLRHIG